MFAALPRAAAVLLAAVALTPRPGAAQVVETRQGDANPMIAVFKSTLYGAGAGLLLGAAIEVADDDDSGEAVKWGFVAGTFFGFGYGLYHVSTRAQPGGFLDRSDGAWSVLPPGLEVVTSSRAGAARAAPRDTGARPSTWVEARVRLVSVRF
jgi:hypothetical protein